MNSVNKFLVVLCSMTLLNACSGGGGSSGAVADTEPSGDVMKNEPILTKEPTQMSIFDNTFFTTFKSKFSTNYTDSITAAYPEDMIKDLINDEIILKSVNCESNSFAGTALSYGSNGFPMATIDAAYSNCAIGNSTMTGSLYADVGTFVKQSFIRVDNDPGGIALATQTSKSYFIWEMKKTTSGTKDTYVYRSREGFIMDANYPKQYVAHWLTFTVDSSSSPATVTATGKVQMYLNDVDDGEILKSYQINFTNLNHYASGGNNCITGTGKLTDGTNVQSGVYLGSSNVSAFGGGPNGLFVCFSKINL